ncbi:hypothetical protein [Haloarchaeobius sp. DFWS5]|uniref:hypothetical protein n=1 Tax=Haloarchaeobius sp. DFWS5 TaxID=3446114 RepID=UPI003EBDE19E
MQLSRRQLLGSVSLALVTGLAGCTFAADFGGESAGTLFVDLHNEGETPTTVTVSLRDEAGTVVDEWPATVVPAGTTDTFRFDRTGGPYEVVVDADGFASSSRWELGDCAEARFVTRWGEADGKPFTAVVTKCDD